MKRNTCIRGQTNRLRSANKTSHAKEREKLRGDLHKTHIFLFTLRLGMDTLLQFVS